MNVDEKHRYAVEQTQTFLRTLAESNPTVLGVSVWLVGNALGGHATRETLNGARLPAADRMAKIGAGLVISDVFESGGSIVGDAADIIGDVTGFTLIAEGVTGTTVKEIIPPIVPEESGEVVIVPERISIGGIEDYLTEMANRATCIRAGGTWNAEKKVCMFTR